MHRTLKHTGRGAARVARTAVTAAAAGALALAATACNLDKVLKVQDQDVTTLPQVTNASGLPTLYGGGLADFQQALTAVDGSITLPGLLTDELRDIDTFPTRIEVDKREIHVTNGTVQGWYRQMHRSRASLERAINGFEQFAPTAHNLAELHALDGFQYIMFAEDFCNGVAYSRFDLATSKEVLGGPNTGVQSLALAVAQFDSALAIDTAGANHYLAEVGKARAQVDLGDYAAAATTVADVPVDFQYMIYGSLNASSENNGVYINAGPPSKRYAVAQKDGTNGLAFRSEGQDSSSKTNPTRSGDARVRWYQSSRGQDGLSTAYYQLKYPDYTSPVVLADGIEAQLIIAEAKLAGGDPTWITTLNNLRSNAALLSRPPYTPPTFPVAQTLPPLVDPVTPAARVDMLFHERAFWLYLSGHRLGDMRRLVSQYARDAETVFPAGQGTTRTYEGAAGGTVGTDVNFPITVDEQNNPNAPACTDRLPSFTGK